MNQPAKIEKKITSYAIKKKDETQVDTTPSQKVSSEDAPSPSVMGEHIDRPLTLLGTTYKIEKSPATGHAMYVTINDIILNQGTDHESRRPFEIFINSKNMDQFQWIVAITRILSAVFRKGGDVSFLAEEMKSVFDPKGGYFKKGSYMPSLVAEIGQVIEAHLHVLGLLESDNLSPQAKVLIDEKQKQKQHTPPPVVNNSPTQTVIVNNHAPSVEKVEEKKEMDRPEGDDESQGSFPPNATVCGKCYQKSLVIMDGCATCLNCGYSKCG